MTVARGWARGRQPDRRHARPILPAKRRVISSDVDLRTAWPSMSGTPRSTSSRRWATTPATRSTSSWPGRPGRWPPPTSPSRSACTSTRCARTSSACATSGLLEVRTDARGAVGRPQHRYSLAPGRAVARARAAAVPVLAAHAAGRPPPPPGRAPDEPAEAGREQGRADARRLARARPCLEALVDRAARRLGFDPERGRRRRRGDGHRLRPLPVPRAGRGPSRPGVQPAPGPGRGLRRRGRRRPRSTTSTRSSTATPVRSSWRRSGSRRLTAPTGPVRRSAPVSREDPP